MSEFDDQINVTPGPGPGTYNVFSGFSKDTLAFTADGLLNLGHWILTHRQELINAPSDNAADPGRDLPGDDHESIETHLQELSEAERRQAEGE